MSFRKDDRVELTKDQQGHGTALNAGRQGDYVAAHPNPIRGEDISHVMFDGDGDATRAVPTDDLKRA